jgi:hypothetical protein
MLSIADDVTAAALVAAALARAAPHTATIFDAARDGRELARLAFRIRKAALAGKDTVRLTAKAAALASKYGAELHTPLDPHGMHVGLTFSPRVHLSGFRSVLFVC